MPRTILIVDDLSINRVILKQLLCREYAVLEAGCGEEALHILSQKHDEISAVLLDIVMPGMDGYEVLRRMRENQELYPIPVIMITGSEDEDSRKKALAIGANDFVMKPYMPDIIKHCLQNNIALRETQETVNALQRDRLTGLYSRETFFEKVREMVSAHEAGYYIMACFDINKFKMINDQYGTGKGDEVLRHVARVFKEGFNAHGGICCRVAADNFAALYPASFQDTEELAYIRRTAANIEDFSTPIAFSIGRYLIDDLSLTPSAMYDRAVLAADTIKGRYDAQIARYDESMRAHLVHEQAIVLEMETALEKGQFEPWFQPQYNHSTGALIGAEALVRWRHPEKGLIPPGAFIPIFEQNGFVYEIDKSVWEQVCRSLRKWKDEGRSPLPVSVNISRYDIFRPDLVDVLWGLVQKYDLSADLLRLEITESAFTESAEQIIAVVDKLLRLGFTIEIDDFGSGYSSLNTLKDVPAQILKLDMKFLDSGNDSQRGGSIIESIVRMAKWLDMAVIAEGVETVQQADFLRSIGCSYIQGYLYARPMPIREYEALCQVAGKEERLIKLETVENLDNNTFWDPASMDTLIFNSFVGGACIYEYHNGKIELLRATEKYAQVIGSAGMTVEDALALNWEDHLDAANRQKVFADLEASIQTKDEITNEYVFLDLPGCPHETYLRSTMRVIASAGDRYLVYCTNENMTAQRQAERREREAVEQTRLIMDNMNSGISAMRVDEEGIPRVVFANDRYYAMLGYTREQAERELTRQSDVVYPEDRDSAKAMMEQLMKDHVPCSSRYRCVKRDGSVIYVRGNKSVASIAGYGENIVISVVTDITSVVLAERQATELSEQLKAIMDNVDLGITASVLQEAGAQFLFANDKYFDILGYTREQFAAEVDDPFLTIVPEDRKRVRTELEQLTREGSSVVLEFGGCRRDGSQIVLRTVVTQGRYSTMKGLVQLSVYRDITAEKRTEQAMLAYADQMHAMMNDMPGGYARIRICADGSLKAVYFNEGFRKLTGMSDEELTALYGDDAMAGVYPDDVPALQTELHKMLRGEPGDTRYRLRHSGGGYVWLSMFGRVTEEQSGERFLNIYYTDAAEKVQEEEKQRELLDNLPFGAALYEYDGLTLTPVHLNKRYWELVERDGAGASVFGAICPEDRAAVLRALDEGIRQKRDMACDLRIRCSQETYRPFHVVGRIVPKGGGKYAVYAAYSPISDEQMTYQQMLPVAMSAIMESTSDLSFVKDMDYRYLCASRAFARMVGLKDQSEVVGETDYDLFEKDTADKFRRDDENLTASGESIIDMVEPIPSEDGVPHYSSTSKYLLRDSAGRVIGLYGVGRDITEYRDAFSKLKLLTDSLPGGIATYECTHEGMRVLYCNDGFRRLFGVERGQTEKNWLVKPEDWVCREDLPGLKAQIERLLNDGTPMDAVYRSRTGSSGCRWISQRAVAADRKNGAVIVYAMLQDVTDQREMMERLRLSEEENELALRLGGSIVCRYTIADKSLAMPSDMADSFGMPDRITDVPGEPVRRGLISPETAEAYVGFFEEILAGGKTGSVIFQEKYIGEWRWLEGRSSTIFSDDGAPVKAIISFLDITEMMEKESVYQKWLQSIHARDPQTYTLLRCNVGKRSAFKTVEGFLLAYRPKDDGRGFDEYIAEYVVQYVAPEDAERFSTAFHSNALLAGFYQAKYNVTLEYRERAREGGFRWLRLTADLVETPHATDVEVYLLFEDIDAAKLKELMAEERAEKDPLTGVLNRSAFADKVNRLIRVSKPYMQHALMMLDIDGFKMVNDFFGHSAGDQALIDVAAQLRGVLRRNDLVGRLGGDEFLVFLYDLPSRKVAAEKAKQICELTRKAFSPEVQISASVGVAVCPQNGVEYETLYQRADETLYHVKETGRNSYAFYRENWVQGEVSQERDEGEPVVLPQLQQKHRVLVVDDNPADSMLLAKMFQDDYTIEKAYDGNRALMLLRHFGTAISAVLLDLMMPGLDGFAVLEKMRQSPETSTIPVIVVSADEHYETGLKAIRAGAADFITKPVDAEVLRIRVQSAISKAENERLRAKNSYLELQNNEVVGYQTVLDRMGLAVAENDWGTGAFAYSPSMSKLLAGRYDGRALWHILLSDLVADARTVKRMQQAAHSLAEDRTRTEGSIVVRLKAASGETRPFCMNVYKLANEFGLTDKMIFSFHEQGMGEEKGDISEE